MSNLSTKIVLIFLFLRFSTSFDCHKCNKGLSEFLPSFKIIVDALKELKLNYEEFLENIEEYLQSDMVKKLCLQLSS